MLFGDGLAAVAIEAFLPRGFFFFFFFFVSFQLPILNRVVAVSIRQISSSASIFLGVFLFSFKCCLGKNGAQAAASVFWTPAPGAAGGADRYRPLLVFLYRFISDFSLLWRLFVGVEAFVLRISISCFQVSETCDVSRKRTVWRLVHEKREKGVEAGIAAD